MNVRLRMYPYPYRGLLALSSDLDGTRTAQEYFELLSFLNTTAPTAMGDGLGIEFANSLYFDTTETQFSYWNSSDEARGALRSLIRSGHIDSLHSLGGQARTRAAVARTMDEVERCGLLFPIFSNHARAPTNFRSEQSTCTGDGDDPASEVYHANRSIATGVTYVWLAQTTSMTAQEVRPNPLDVFSPEHRLASFGTVARQAAKLVWGRWSPRYAMHPRNRVLRETHLSDGQPVLEFMRSNAHWGGISRGESGLALDQAGLLSGATVGALHRLADCDRRGQLLLLTTARALDYHALLRHLDCRCDDGPDAVTIHLRLSCRGSLRDRLERFLGDSGLSFYVDGTRPLRIVYEDRDSCPLRHNPPDHTGNASVRLPLQRPDFSDTAP